MEDRLPRHAGGAPAARNGVVAADSLARVFDDQFANVYDLVWHLAASEEDAAEVTREVFGRLKSDALVRGRGDVGGRLAATAYHISAARPERSTQPTGARAQALPSGLVAAVNAHAAHCRRCGRWGPLPYREIGEHGNLLPTPFALKASIWRGLSGPTAVRAEPAAKPPFRPERGGPGASRFDAGGSQVARPRQATLTDRAARAPLAMTPPRRSIQRRHPLALFIALALLLTASIGSVGAHRILGGSGAALTLAVAPLPPRSTPIPPSSLDPTASAPEDVPGPGSALAAAVARAAIATAPVVRVSAAVPPPNSAAAGPPARQAAAPAAPTQSNPRPAVAPPQALPPTPAAIPTAAKSPLPVSGPKRAAPSERTAKASTAEDARKHVRGGDPAGSD